MINASVPMTNCGPKEEVKLGLVNAIRSRRVALGLDEMPVVEPKKPRIETVRRPMFSICFQGVDRFNISSCGFETINMIIAVSPLVNLHVIEGHVLVIRSDEGLTLETSSFQIFPSGNIQSLSTRLIKPNCYVPFSHRHSTTVSLETRNLFTYSLRRLFF